MREIPQPEFLPYELMSEQLVEEQQEYIEKNYGTNPHVIFANLGRILQEFGHDCLELGAGLAHEFPTTGAADLFDAFIAGLEYGRIGGDDES